MDHVQITMEGNDSNWREICNQRMNTLKAEQFTPEDSDSLPQKKLFEGEYSRGKKFMGSELYHAVKSGNPQKFIYVLEQVSTQKCLSLTVIFDQVGNEGESLFHVAAQFGKEKIAELIAYHYPTLLTKRNINGDTALHVAAKAKSSNVIKVILSQYAAEKSKSSVSSIDNGDNELTRLTNEHGNTALHEAVNSKHHNGVILLVLADKTMAHYSNKAGISPLYLGVVLNLDMEFLDLLLQAPFPDNKPLPSYHGNSALHAAIATENLALLNHIADKRPELMYLRDEDGGLPLHFAAAVGYLQGVRILSEKSTLATVEWNKNGHCPIHLACKRGHVEVVKIFLQQNWPVATKLLNKKGQNILHVAAKNGKDNMVKYLLRSQNVKELNINEKDKNGNTPLHLASMKFYSDVMLSLTQDNRIVMNIRNNDGVTPLEAALMNCEVPTTTRESASCAVLRHVSEPESHSEKVRRMLYHRFESVTPNFKWIRDRINTIAVVAILIASVTFSAAFAVPGGVYSTEDPNPQNRGMAVLATRIWFQVFTICNTIAMSSATAASFILFWSQLDDAHLAGRIGTFALQLVGWAIMAMLLNIAALRLVVGKVSWLADVLTVIGVIFMSLIFIALFSLYHLLIMPLRFARFLHFSDFLLRFYIKIYGRFPKKHKNSVSGKHGEVQGQAKGGVRNAQVTYQKNNVE